MAKRKNKKQKKVNKIKQHVTQVFLLSLIMFTIIFGIYQIVQLVINPVESFLVEEGTISKEENRIGYVIRNEQIIKSNEQQTNIVQIKNEGEKVAVGEAVLRYKAANEKELEEQINKINEEIQKSLEGQSDILSSDIKALEKQIESKVYEIRNKNNMQEVREYKKDINSYIEKKARISGELSPAGSYINGLISQKTAIQKELYNSSQYEKAPIAGIVSYRIDGLEEVLNSKNFMNLTSKYLKDLNITTGQIVTTSDNLGKVIDNFECYIATVTNSEEAKKAKIGDKVRLRLSGNQVINAEVKHINKEEKDIVIIFRINQEVERLASYRKVSLDIIWWQEQGLRVPKTSIIYENGLSYIIRIKADLLDKILVKVVNENENDCIVTNYTTKELQNIGYSATEIKKMKKISIYDEILINPDLKN